ncbi:MAG TPA: FAD-dependent oxidoreductase [Terriglobales bacterium]|nr:FAD-dependent oxidoreductase [Terriglobales bacterium]
MLLGPPPNLESNNSQMLFSRRRLMKACAAIGWSGTLGDRFPFFKFPSANMLKQAQASGTTKAPGTMAAKSQVAVIGAGAFGSWTALYLLRRGARVTLLDAWGPGNSRASSGGETRVIRGTYGPNQPYTKMAARATQLWKENQQRWNLKLMHQTGVLWMVASGDDHFERGSLAMLREAGIPYQELSRHDLSTRWPQINLEGLQWGIYEPEGGYLTARIACQAVLDGFLREGGDYRQLAVMPNNLDRGPGDGLTLSDGSKLRADLYIFACGPWLGKLFPETIGNRIRPTRQEVFFFGTPAGDDRFSDVKLPVWADHRDKFMYGIPGNQGRGFKIADDTRGPEFDPTSGERSVSAQGLKSVRDYIAFRFPALKDAPLVESRVCQYENSPDNNFIIDRHPAQQNVWLLGGGSGHGFKHGPALGEMVAGLVIEGKDPDPLFRLGRLGN